MTALPHLSLSKLVVTVVVVLAGIITAHADPTVVSGSMTLGNGTSSAVRGPVNITGTNFSANVTTVGGNFGLAHCSTFLAGLNGPCAAANVSGVSIGTDLIGSFTVNGMVFSSDVVNQMNLSFTGPAFVIPAAFLGASAVQITAPFTFSGGANSPLLSGPVLLQGQGTVYVVLIHRTVGLFPGFYLDHADYIFGPQASEVTVQEVPEPTTLLLFVSGLGSTAIYLRRRKK